MPRKAGVFSPSCIMFSLAVLFELNLKTRSLSPCLETIPGHSYRCMELNLTRIPSGIPNSTQILDLSFNPLKILHSNYFSAVLALRFLDLTRCHLWKIEDHAFAGLTNLSVLILTGNPLQILGPRIFHDLPSLQRFLAVETNLFSLASFPIGHLTSLQELNLSHNRIDSLKLPGYFSDLIFLRHLNLRLNNISSISVGDLDALVSQNLTLVLSRNDIKYIEWNAFEGLHLQELVLRGCFENGVIMQASLRNMSGSHVNSLVLGDYRNIHRLESIDKSLVDVLCDLHLQELTLIEADSMETGSTLSLCLNNISRVRLVHTYIDDTFTFPNDSNLYQLEFKNSALNMVPAKSLSSLKKLKVLRITHNKNLIYLKNYFEGLPSLETLDLSVNRLVTHLSWIKLMKGAPNLKYLNLSFNTEIRLSIECSGPAKLEYLDFQHTALASPGTVPSFFCLHNLIYLDISYTDTTVIAECSFCGLHKLRVLKMAGNRFANDQLVDNFRNLTELHFLDVSNCQLQHISLSSLTNLHELQLLNVSHNKLLGLHPETYVHTPLLNTLDFHNNQLVALTEEDLKNLPASLKHLDLSENLFDCSCDHLDFLRWTKNSSTLLQNINNMVCSTPMDLKNVPVMGFDLAPCEISTTIVAVSVTLVLVLITILILVYKYYFYLYYTMVLFLGNRSSEEKETVYDAFVIFSSRDQEWVNQELQRPLEEELPYFRLCLFYRDFIPGVSIITNIIKEGFQNSQKVIAVVSDHFLESRWCNFELEVAQSWQLVDSKASLILVVIEGVDKAALNRKLGLFRYLRRNTFLTWKDRDISRHVFLRQLRSALLEGKTWTEEELRLMLKK
ncbi:toll-like receptor 4 [Crotalus tigris]|uniref:toll-like receptor 4 n=1 Tax=Crotalus tigris TaxID=88082 RepID=UPI00192F6AFA|nr:toll-like receptor 4 [Crotalus tigris]XP_039178821.1 toll-like receptor 4 [Crotalus tigris]